MFITGVLPAEDSNHSNVLRVHAQQEAKQLSVVCPGHTDDWRGCCAGTAVHG